MVEVRAKYGGQGVREREPAKVTIYSRDQSRRNGREKGESRSIGRIGTRRKSQNQNQEPFRDFTKREKG